MLGTQWKYADHLARSMYGKTGNGDALGWKQGANKERMREKSLLWCGDEVWRANSASHSVSLGGRLAFNLCLISICLLSPEHTVLWHYWEGYASISQTLIYTFALNECNEVSGEVQQDRQPSQGITAILGKELQNWQLTHGRRWVLFLMWVLQYHGTDYQTQV